MTIASRAEQAKPDEARGLLMPPLHPRYFYHPDQCHHGYIIEFGTASTIGQCRGCGTMIAAIAKSIEV